MAKRIDPEKQSGCLLLFSLPFALAGLILFGVAASDLYQAMRAAGFREVPARLLEVGLDVTHGHDSTSYQATATYEYEVHGTMYQGTRVGLHSGGDNVGDYQRTIYAELSRCRNAGDPHPCYVDPKDPSNAVLDPKLRWELVGFYCVGFIAFGGAGFGLFFFALYSKRRRKVRKALLEKHADEPWLSRPEWHGESIPSSDRGPLIISIFFAGMWNAISAPLWFFIPEEVSKGNWVVLIALLFPLIGMALLIWAGKNVLRWIKYGQSRFKMSAPTGVIGGMIGGAVMTRKNLIPESGFHLTLKCVRRVRRRSGSKTSVSESTVWKDERVMGRELLEEDRTRSAIPVLFAIPHDSLQTDDSDSINQIVWRLEVTAEVPGVDYHSQFEVPVYRTAESSRDFKLDESSVASFLDDSPRDEF